MYFNSTFIIINDDESVAECVKKIRSIIFSKIRGAFEFIETTKITY